MLHNIVLSPGSYPDTGEIKMTQTLCVQNADDNSYPSARDALPSLAFVIEKDCITILNNECGFEERNVRAICDVGRSTKGKHTYGYIGNLNLQEISSHLCLNEDAIEGT